MLNVEYRKIAKSYAQLALYVTLLIYQSINFVIELRRFF